MTEVARSQPDSSNITDIVNDFITRDENGSSLVDRLKTAIPALKNGSLSPEDHREITLKLLNRHDEVKSAAAQADSNHPIQSIAKLLDLVATLASITACSKKDLLNLCSRLDTAAGENKIPAAYRTMKPSKMTSDQRAEVQRIARTSLPLGSQLNNPEDIEGKPDAVVERLEGLMKEGGDHLDFDADHGKEGKFQNGEYSIRLSAGNQKIGWLFIPKHPKQVENSEVSKGSSPEAYGDFITNSDAAIQAPQDYEYLARLQIGGREERFLLDEYEGNPDMALQSVARKLAQEYPQ